ncbi:uncharacterized protein LOC116778540 isoform X2 [Danaus plexippus]|uniref:uncharacterized protein LOC116778540 isoform X2 n=1 Tax=Danaus plexippus TaxID=13037 RepID=UPI002AAFF38C|nr:uncharacterized protein LOC116778540 isoform X2 [Danaus plexippus]
MALSRRSQLSILVLVNLIIRNYCDVPSNGSEEFKPLGMMMDEGVIVDDEPSEDLELAKEENVTITLGNGTDVYDEGGDITTASPLEMLSTYRDVDYGTNSQPETTIKSLEDAKNTTQPEELFHHENPGQRNPKTEEIQQSFDLRTFEKPKPAPYMNRSTTLKSWLEDSWLRPPAGILVPLRPLALNRALGVWNDLANEGLNLTDIVIVGYDSNGVNWRSRHNLQTSSGTNGDRAVGDALSKLLLSYQDVYTDSSNDGTMRALASAAKLVPYDSALFLVTDKGAGDPQRLPLALRALVEKRLKVYTIWTDPSHPSVESELALQDLRNISSHTEGEVLAYSLQVIDEDNSNLASEVELQPWEPVSSNQARRARINNHPDVENFDTLLVRRGRAEALTLGIPVETGVTALRLLLEGAIDHAVLYPPNDGPQIDLYNETSVKMYSASSTIESISPQEVYIVVPGWKLYVDMLSVLPVMSAGEDVAMTGMWHLSVRCDTCDYRLTVSARSHIHFDVEFDTEDSLNIKVTGNVASVRDSSVIDEYGATIEKLSFSYQPSTEAFENKMADIFTSVPVRNVSGNRAYVKIAGRDFKGETFARVAGPIHGESEVRMGRSAAIIFPESINDLEVAEEMNSKTYNEKIQNESDVLFQSEVQLQRNPAMTAVQIGLSSRLYGSPESRLQLHFEVTNLRDTSVFYRFGAVGELRFLTGINPESQTVAAGQTVNVIVSLLIASNAQVGARDLIKFTAYGQSEQVSLSSYVYVVSSGDNIRDLTPPDVRHNFQGTCLGRLGSDCAEHVWSTSVIARDAMGGLLRLSSTPAGISYNAGFISGSRDEIIATYRANCCAPRVVVNAVDAFGNTNTYTIDISNYINEATIAAIALGVILILILIFLIIILTYFCVKRRKESRELPTYSTSRSSRNIT